MGCATWLSILVSGVAAVAALFRIAYASDSMDGPLDWDAPADCPTQQEIRARVREAVGSGNGGLSKVRVMATIRGVGTEWHAWVNIETSNGFERRAFDGRSCMELSDAVVVIVALAARAASVSSTDSASPALPEQSSSEALPTSSREVAPASVAAPTSSHKPRSDPAASLGAQNSDPLRTVWRPRLVFAFGMGADSSTLRSPLAWTQAVAGLALDSSQLTVRFEVRASYFFPTMEVAVPSQDEELPGRLEGGRFRLFALGGALCLLRRSGSIDLGACAGAEIEGTVVSAFGAARNPGASSSWGSLDGGAILAIPLSRNVYLRTELSGIFPLEHHVFTIQLPQSASLTVLDAPLISGRVAESVEVRFF
jgi:hypothetical protein